MTLSMVRHHSYSLCEHCYYTAAQTEVRLTLGDHLESFSQNDGIVKYGVYKPF